MRQFADKRKVKRILYSPFSVIILATLVFFLGRSVWKAYSKNTISREARAGALRQIKELEARKAELEAKLEKLQSPEGLESEIRDKLPVAKEGEEVIIIVDDQNNE